MEHEKIKIKEKLGFGVLAGSENMTAGFVSTFILFFYTNVLGIQPAVGGMITSLSVIWDAINDPLIANFADNHYFRNGERIRPYMICIPVPMTMCLLLMFSVFNVGVTARTVIAFAIYLLFVTLKTFERLPMYAMPQLATADISQRISINTFVSGGATLGSVLASLALWPVVRGFAGLDADGNMINPQKGFLIAAGIIGFVLIVCYAYCFFVTKERVIPEKTERTRIVDAIAQLIKNYDFRWNLAFTCCYVVINTISTSVLVYYCSAVIRNEGAVTPVMAAFVLASLLTLPFVGKIHAKLGRRKSMMLGAGLILLGQLVFWINRYSLIHMFVYSFLLGISVPLNIVMYATNRADITDIQAYKTGGKRIDSMVHNASGFVEKAANALVIAAIGWVLQFAHYDGNLSVQPESAVKAIVGLLSVGVLIAAVIMLFAASRIRVEEHLKEARESGV